MNAPPRSGDTVSKVLSGLATFALAAAVGLALFVAYYIYSMGGGSPGAIDPTFAGLAVGKPAPSVSAEGWVNGEPASLEGKVVVVHGWFYDCPFCWQEAPHVAALHEKYGDRVAFVGLTPDPPSDLAKVEEFVAKGEMKYPVGYGAIDSLVAFEAKAFPAVWVVGADGTVVWNRAVEAEQSLEEAIEAALRPRTAS